MTEVFTFSDFAPTPEIEFPSVAKVIWDRDQNLDLRQAETTALEDRAREAEENAVAAKASLAEARLAIAEANKAIEKADIQRVGAEAAVFAAQQEFSRIESEKVELRATVAALDTQAHTLEEQARLLEEEKARLSERRAMPVRDFIALQGIAAQRSVAVGYGFDRPVADNTTREGRAKNRRVDIVIAEGVIAEESAPAP